MKSKVLAFLILLLPLSVFSFTDESHFSKTFNATRFFRVFTPPDYNSENSSKRYPVIYYFHGCGGSYRSSGPYSYADYGLTPPEVLNGKDEPDYEFPNNIDFENVVSTREVIIICVDGKIPDLPNCGVYFPSQLEPWKGNYYNFSTYIRELISVVDSRYNTLVGPHHRAISGLSMGGHTAIWVAAANPFLFSSASEFCHSPQYYDVGEPLYQTTIDVKQLWRNLRGLPFRHTATDRDYLRYFTQQLYETFCGAGFENEYYLANFCAHWAGRIDLQFDFHLDHFATAKTKNPCFSHINLYPSFDVGDYHISSAKTGNGWIYLRDVTKNGFGIYTRERLPWGKALSNFHISLTTPPLYTPNEKYTVSRYSYRKDSVVCEAVLAESDGRLKITSNGGMGEEIGISGHNLQSPIVVLTDTINENIYLERDTETCLSFDVVNLSTTVQTVDFKVSTDYSELLSIKRGTKQVTIPALSKITVDSFLVCLGNFLPDYKNKGYINISSSINGTMLEKEHFIQVTVKDQIRHPAPSSIKIFDGRSESLSLFKYKWNQWNEPLSSGLIKEGSGNGNGIAEFGETFSIWIKAPSSIDSLDNNTWHPVVPVNRMDNPDISMEKVIHHRFSTGRPVLSAQIRLNRKPEANKPVRIPLQSEFLKVHRIENDCHRNTADGFGYSYFEILLYEDGTIEIPEEDHSKLAGLIEAWE